jgi:hypothetical protein
MILKRLEALERRVSAIEARNKPSPEISAERIEILIAPQYRAAKKRTRHHGGHTF